MSTYFEKDNKNDLYRSRRIKYERNLPLLKSSKKVIKKGSLIGGSFIGFILFISSLITLQILLSQYKIRKLQPVVEKYDSTIREININKQSLVQINKFNKRLANAIVDIRSGSALLAEISKLIPNSLTLTSINVLNNNLTINGIANGREGLKIINLFMLEMNSSPLISRESVSLLEANIQTNKESGQNQKREFIEFTLKAEITEDIKNVNQNHLKELGSNGLANRIQILENYKLIQ